GSHDWAGIKRLVSPTDNNTMALYWLGRAKEKLGEDAHAIYQRAAKTRSYYGFLAADKIGQAYQFNAQPITPDSRIQRNFEKNISLIRGKLLYQMGEISSARNEILPLAKRMNKITQRQLAYWLNQQGFHHDAIYVLGKLREWNDIDIRFPTPYNVQVEAAHRLTNTEPTWIYAIIRQESSMNPRAKSRANAKGLMQLIPSTARKVARDLGLPLYGDDIYNPNINTKLGAEYLNQMYQRFGNIALASAAYNAGPGRVDKWISSDVSDMPIWVEKIPFNETRKYVKHITEYQQVYAKHLGKQIPTITEILSYQPTATPISEPIPEQLTAPIDNTDKPTLEPMAEFNVDAIQPIEMPTVDFDIEINN
ncbi:MAG: transglycosylase SLT domain-containing protein, partial [Gammaproteobacteria bacterium]|nr:transglycosylase SLT domain-containing protein [Gammaproteobacteria bacterium]